MRKLFITLGLLLLIVAQAVAQSSASATASAVIVVPVTISTSVAAQGDVIKLNTRSFGATRTRRGRPTGASAPQLARNFLIAKLTISGDPHYLYSVSVASPGAITSACGSQLMVDLFMKKSRLERDGSSSAFHTEGLELSATLRGAAYQAPGVYSTSTPAQFTVNYN